MAGADAATGRLAPGAAYYASIGWKIFPCYGIIDGRCGCGSSHTSPKDMGKHPQGMLVREGHSDATSETGKVEGWWKTDPEANVAVSCAGSGFIVIDVDPRNGGLESWEKLEELLLVEEGLELPPTVEACTGVYAGSRGEKRGRHLFYKVQDGESLRGGLEGLKGIDIKHRGYVLINPSRHGSGVIYEWRDGHAPWDIVMAEAPEEFLKLIRKRAPHSAGGGSYGIVDWGGKKIDVDAVVAAGIEEGERVNTLYPLACAFANKYPIDSEHGKAAVRGLMRGINAKHVRPPLEVEELDFQVGRAIEFVLTNPKSERLWEGIEEYKALMAGMEEGTAGSFATAAPPAAARREITAVPKSPLRPPVSAGSGGGGAPPTITPVPTSPSGAPMPGDKDSLDEDAGGEIGGRTFTDIGNGRRLVDHEGWRLRNTPNMGWFVWSGEYWVPDEGGVMIQEITKGLSVHIAREVASAAGDADKEERVVKHAWKAKNLGEREKAIKDAQSDTRIVVSARTWDSNPHLLGVTNGVINLRDGKLLPPSQEHYITKQSKVAYTPGWTTTQWTEFLNFATGGDVELQNYLQLAAGYTLTGLRDHEVLFLVYGPAGSGKSTLLEVLGTLLGDYYMPMDSDVLVEQPGGSKNSTEYYMAQLLGKRMIGISEWPESRGTKEEAVKRLTGDMTISGRHPGGKPFQFESQAKLWIGTNSKPRINDAAMWRRVRAIHFNHVPERPDPALKPFLLDPRGGLPGALSWAVDGAVKLLSSPVREPLGLAASAHVRRSTEEYKHAEDRMGLFLEEETTEAAGTSVNIKDLFYVYRRWCDDRGEQNQTQVAFTKRLEERGLRMTGRGSRATVEGRYLAPKIVAPPSSDAWGSIVDSARKS